MSPSPASPLDPARPDRPRGPSRRARPARLGAWALLAAAALAPPLRADAALPDAELAAVRRAIDERARSIGSAVLRLEVRGAQMTLGLALPTDAAPGEPTAAMENLFEDAVGMVSARDEGVASFTLLVGRPGGPLAPPTRPASPRDQAPAPAVDTSRRLAFAQPTDREFPDGQALRGKTIALSPGHGYIFYSNLNGYSTQRARISWDGCGGCRGIVEDFETHEIIVRHLVPLLEGAGARVVLVRERDYGGEGVIVDDADAGFRAGGGLASAARAEAWAGREQRGTSGDATWTIRAPATGPQWLSTYFAVGADQAADATLEISGPFGLRRFQLDQRTHGRRFSPIVQLDLDAGAELQVTLRTGASGARAAFDALRLGAGKHSTGNAWWSMGAEPFAELQRAPSSVLANGDVSIRPVYAEWFGADVYLSFHSNAAGQANSTAAGTSVYRYNCGTIADHSSPPPASQCDDPVGSDRLQRLVQAALVEALRAEWDPNWRDRGARVANFGELRGLSAMPGVLVEIAFHDNVVLASGSNLRMTDNQSLHDPRFRRIVAKAMFRALAAFLTGTAAEPPARVEALAARRLGSDRVEVRWQPVSGATRYRVELAQGQRTFGRAELTPDARLVVDGLTPDVPTFVRVSALNAAGQGLPSKVVAVRPSARPAQLLVVDAFDREDAWVQEPDNQRNTALVHGLALADAGHALDGATEAAWAAGLVDASSYDGLVLAFGRESTADAILTPTLRAQVADAARAGKAIFASGSEIGWTLDARGDADTRAFLAEVFGVSLADDDAGATALAAAPGGWLARGVSGTVALDDGSAGGVEARSSDAFTPGAGAIAELGYGAAAGPAAAVRKGKNLIVGVALDSVVGAGARGAIAATWAREAVALAPPIEVPDAGVGVDAAPIDVGLPDAREPVPDAGLADTGAVLPDAEPTVDARPRGVLVSAVGPDEDPITGGCGCATAPGARAADARGAPLGALGVVVVAFAARRRRPAATRRAAATCRAPPAWRNP